MTSFSGVEEWYAIRQRFVADVSIGCSAVIRWADGQIDWGTFFHMA